MFNTFMDFMNDALQAFSQDVLLFIAIGTIAACLILGILAMLFSSVRRQKRRFKAYNKHIKEKGIKKRDTFDSLHTLICKKRTQVTAVWEQNYPDNTCAIVYYTPSKLFVGRARRMLFFLIAFASAAFLVLALQASDAPFLVLPLVMLLLIFLLECFFSCCDGIAQRRLAIQQRKFQVSVIRAFTEVLGMRTCICCCDCSVESKITEEKKKDKDEKEEKGAEKPEPAEAEQIKDEKSQKPNKEVVPQKETTEKHAQKQNVTSKSFPDKESDKEERKAVTEPKVKPQKVVPAPEPKSAKVIAKVESKVEKATRETKKEPVKTRKSEFDLWAAPEAPPKVETKAPSKAATKPTVKAVPANTPNKTAKTVSKPLAEQTPKSNAAPEAEGAVEDRMSALSARLGTLRKTFTETTVEQTIENQVVESVITKQGDETSTSESSSQTFATRSMREVSSDGKIVEQSASSLGFKRDREKENDKVVQDSVSFYEVSTPTLKLESPRESRENNARLYSPAPQKTRKTSRSSSKKPAKFNESEVQNALFGLMSAMSKQQNQNDI